MSKFHNPYNFIPLGKPLEGMLGQAKPAGHDRYHEELWSGRIEIEIETVSPLLIPDAARAEESKKKEEKGHKIFAVRRAPDGRPLLPATSLKGALRSAYEAVTNSRLGVFKGHEAPPARRMKGTRGAAMVPARVVEVPGGFAIELWKGLSRGWPERHVSANGQDYFSIRDGRRSENVFAAWLPRYKKGVGGIAPWAGKIKGHTPRHGEEVFCWLESIQHVRRHFSYWAVREMARDRASLSPAHPRPSAGRGDHQPQDPPQFRVGRGFVFISEQNTENKHDERVFFVGEGEDPETLLLPLEKQRSLSLRWSQLIGNYQNLHEKEIEERGGPSAAARFLGRQPGKTAFSRHVFTENELQLRPGTAFDCDQSKTPEAGTLCYAQLRMDGNTVWLNRDDEPEIEALYPVMISRELGHVSPLKLLPDQMRPAADLRDLSPADRVFGWVKQKGTGAYKGQLRIHSIECETPASDAIETFKAPLPLAILGAPKTAQARFYVGAANGAPLRNGEDTANAGYFAKDHPENWALRGRKVYPHHAAITEIETYWDREKAENDAASPNATGAGAIANRPLYREYVRRPDGQHGNADSQNRSIREWVKPKTKFKAAIDVVNLNIAELGVLLWLLSLPDGTKGEASFHRLGGGKPLGFGSAKIGVRSVDLASGAARRARYEAFFAEGFESPFAVTGGPEAAQALMHEAEKAWGSAFETLPSARAFLQAARGYRNAPTHYPRRDEWPNPAGENFKWFGENENGRPGHPRRTPLKRSLPANTADGGLPLDPTD